MPTISFASVSGGGIPVITDEKGKLKGVAAVIDKDRASALLGAAIGAKLFLISTSVDKVYLNFGKSNQKFLDCITVKEASHFLTDGHFPAGSMGPKIQAAINFLQNGGERVIITSSEKSLEAIQGKAGTVILP